MCCSDLTIAEHETESIITVWVVVTVIASIALISIVTVVLVTVRRKHRGKDPTGVQKRYVMLGCYIR